LNKVPQSRRSNPWYEEKVAAFLADLDKTFDAGGYRAFEKKDNSECNAFIEDQVKSEGGQFQTTFFSKMPYPLLSKTLFVLI
jgi:hypothetical protein